MRLKLWLVLFPWDLEGKKHIYETPFDRNFLIESPCFPLLLIPCFNFTYTNIPLIKFFPSWLAGLSDMQHYNAERIRERKEVLEQPKAEEQEIVDILSPYGLDREALEPVISKFRSSPEKWVDFMMRFELGLEKPNSKQSWVRGHPFPFLFFPFLFLFFFDCSSVKPAVPPSSPSPLSNPLTLH